MREQPDPQLEYRFQIRELAQKVIAACAAKTDRQEQMQVSVLEQMAKVGLFGCEVDKKYGGAGKDSFSYLAAVEELAKVDGSHAAMVAAHNSIGVGSIVAMGSEEQKQTYLPMLCSGKKLWGFALTERQSGSDAASIKTTAYERQSGEWVIRGEKHWITNTASELTAGVTVMALTSEPSSAQREFSCFLVPTGTDGFYQHPMTGKLMWRATTTGRLEFRDAVVSGQQLLGKRGQGMKSMIEVLNSGRLSIAAMGLGLAQGAYELAREHALSKTTFGKLLMDHQAVAFKLAEMKTQIQAARALLDKAIWLKSEGQSFRVEASMAKLFASEVAEFCAREGLQIVAGEGLFHPHPMERFYRDATILRIGEGTSEIQKLIIARDIRAHP